MKLYISDHSNFLKKIVLEMLDTASILKFTEVKASGLFVLYCGIFEAVELDIKPAVFSNVVVHKNSNSRDAVW